MIRVREQDVLRIPEIVARHEEEFGQRALLARAAWEEWFAPEVRFHRAVEACSDILRSRFLPERVVSRIPYVGYPPATPRSTQASRVVDR